MQFLLITSLFCLATQEAPATPSVNENAAVKLSNDYIKIDTSSFKNSKLEITDIVQRISADDIWQSAPYCGLNCLFVVLSLHGSVVDYKSLKKEVAVTNRGASLLDLKAVAAKYGYAAEVIRTTPADLRHLDLPIIALLGADMGPELNGHYVVVCGEIDADVFVIDGTSGNLDQMSTTLFNRAFSGYVLAKRDRGVLDTTSYGGLDIMLLIGCAGNIGFICFALLGRNS
jgi:predicted double-glycine peptidase